MQAVDLLVPVIIGVSALVFVLLFGTIARRLLGIRFGRVRILLAGALGFWVAGPISLSLGGSVPSDEPGITPLWFMILALAASVLAAMVFLVIAEAVVPSGSLPMPVELVRGLRGRMRRSRRYTQITAIAVRHGLGPYLRGRRRGSLDAPSGRARLARSLREALDEGGVTFVKLGQVLSTRRDVLPAEFVDELSRLQDHATPAPWDEVEQVLTAELGRPVDEVFVHFERRPLAAASVAQVHLATLPDRTEVVVKVQRPGVARVVERDLDLVARLAGGLHREARWARNLGVRDLAQGFAVAMREELDFLIEADNMTAVAAAAHRAADGGVRLPVPHRELCTRRVLVMERLGGTPLGAAEGRLAEAGVDRHALAKELLDAVLRQIVLDGVFHADPHPGNVLVLDGGGLGLLDFGSVGRLDVSLRQSLQRLLLALDRSDHVAFGDALLELVLQPDDIDEDRFERATGRFLARHLAPGTAPSAAMFADLFRIVAEHRLSIPPEVAAVFRALATLEGTLDRLSPGFDVVTEARGLAAGYVGAVMQPRALRSAVEGELMTLLPLLRRLPRRVDRITRAVEHGRLGVNVRLFADERDRAHVTGLVHQVLLAFLGATAGIMAVLLLGTRGGPQVTDAVSLLQFLGYNLLVICGILVLRVLVLIFRPDR
jgi:ubiquinone biosynthesis protein